MRENKTRTIYEALLALIAEHKYVADFRLPSENELAARFSASRMSAKLALDKLERQSLIRRVRGSGSYVNTDFVLSAANPYPDQNCRIGVVLPLDFSRFLYTISRAVYGFFQDKGLFCQFFYFRTDEEEDALLSHLRALRFDGILFYPNHRVTPSTALLELVEEHFPIVLIDRYFKGLDIYTVSSNHFASGRKIAEFLRGADKKHICFISETPSIATSIQHRYNGFRSIVAGGGSELFYDKENASAFPALCCEHLRQHPDIDAVVTYSGPLAIHVLNALKALGKVPGREVTLALYDEEIDFDRIIDFSYVKINQQTELIGSTAAEILYYLLRRLPLPAHLQKQNSIPTSIELVNAGE